MNLFAKMMSRLGGRSPNRGNDGRREPSAPEGTCVYAVGDIHGERKALDRMLAAIAADAERQRANGLEPAVVFLGDYIDRGTDSCGVLDRLCRDPLAGVPCRFLLGNHEAAMLDFIGDPVRASEWLNYGGAEALGSYGIRASVGTSDPARCRALRDALMERLPDEHLAFLKALEPMVVLGDYAFVHAGIRPGRPLARQRTDDLLTIREPFLSWPHPHEKTIVHGHTITRSPEVTAARIGIDTGAYATGTLTALALCGTARSFIQVTA